MSRIGRLAPNGRTSGSIRFDGQEILGAKPKVLNKIRAERIAMIFQDPMTSLNPYMRISEQMAEVLTLHQGLSKRDALAESVRMLDAVKIPAAKERIRLFPHEFSGGMRQRVMIAMSLLCKPDLLIADEPTTALDVTVQAQIMDLLGELQKDFGMATILITHDLGVVAEIADTVAVMYAGTIVETGPAERIFNDPQHPYTIGLMSSIPQLTGPRGRLSTVHGMVPTTQNMPQGCRFATRCPFAQPACAEEPPLAPLGDGHAVACHFAPLEQHLEQSA